MFRTICTLLVILATLAGGGCRSAAEPSSSSDGRVVPVSRPAPAESLERGASEVETGDPTGAVTLRQAAALALLSNPDLKAYAFERRAAEAHKLQAGLRPNPTLKAQVGEFAGSGDRSGFDAAETTITLGQLIELGDKRGRRVRVASLETELAESDYESRRLDVLQNVTSAFVEVLAAQERLAVTEQLRDLSQAAQSAVAQRVAAGKDSAVEDLRAGVAFSKSQIETQNAARALVSARRKLAATWGSRNAAYQEVAGDFYDVHPAPTLDDVGEALAANPDLAHWAIAQRQRRAALDLEKARGTLDVTVSGGVQYFRETDDTSFVAGLALPIPLFDRNQGGVLEATERLAQTRQAAVAAELDLGVSLAEALNRLAGAYDEVGVLRTDVLPKAQQALEAASEGYREGKFDYLHVLDAQRTLFESRVQYIDVVERYHVARAEVERLTAQSLDRWQRQDEPRSEGADQ